MKAISRSYGFHEEKSSITRRLSLVLGVVAGVVACAPHVPFIRQPLRIEAFCGLKLARPTAIASALTSTDDRMLPVRPTLAQVRKITAAGDGAIAYWNEQPVALPRTSAALGERDGYVRIRAVAVAPHIEGSDRRPIYLDVRDHGIYRWIQMNAFDLEDVCIEGKPQS